MSESSRRYSPIKCPDCDSVNVKQSAVMSFSEWGKKPQEGLHQTYTCEDCGLQFEAPSFVERQDMQNGMTLIIVVTIMIVMLLIVLL